VSSGTDIMAIATQALQQFSNGIAGKDLANAKAVFVKDPIFMGSRAGEAFEGAGRLEDFLKVAFAAPATFSWRWSTPIAHGDDQLMWLVAEGTRHMARPDEDDQVKGYQASGVLRRSPDGQWLWALFHGSVQDVS
jgi:hypothetical protein